MFRRRPYRDLERRLGYRFRNESLLETALTHPSYRHESPSAEGDNQRLEFLGDAALALLSAAWLYAQHPGLSEGELTRLRANMTRAHVLAEIGREIGVGSFLRLGKGEAKTGGQQRAKVLEDTVEAIIGAAFIDGGFRVVERIFRRCLLPAMQKMQPRWDAGENPKGRLLEYCQKHGLAVPVYEVVEARGPMHQREFSVEVRVNGRIAGRGEGRSKKLAEQAAAAAAVRLLANPQT